MAVGLVAGDVVEEGALSSLEGSATRSSDRRDRVAALSVALWAAASQADRSCDECRRSYDE